MNIILTVVRYFVNNASDTTDGLPLHSRRGSPLLLLCNFECLGYFVVVKADPFFDLHFEIRVAVVEHIRDLNIDGGIFLIAFV